MELLVPKLSVIGGVVDRHGALAPLVGALLCLSPVHQAAAGEGDFIIRDFHFKSGETLPELRLHYLTLGQPAPDARGQIANAVLILHGTGGSGRQFMALQFAGVLFGAGALLDTARDGADVVLGSRYVPGGGVTDWGPVRRLVSRGGSWYARVALGMREHDLTGGFKCFRRAALETIELDTVRSQGYAFQIELSYRAARRGLRIVEVPIVFRERRVGTSKMSARIALEAFWRVPQMRGWR